MRRMGKLGCAAEAAMHRIETAHELLVSGLKRRSGQISLISGRRRSDFGAQGIQQRPILLAEFGRVLAVMAMDPLQDVDEGRHSVAGRFGKIGAADERDVVVVGQKHRQRPAAGSLVQQVEGGLIDFVEVGPFFAIHLDVDEQAIHHLGGGFVLEGFMSHDVAPVAGRVADGQQDRLAFVARLLQRLRAPGMPVHRVVRVLAQVGAGFVNQAVGVQVFGHGGIPVGGEADRAQRFP